MLPIAEPRIRAIEEERDFLSSHIMRMAWRIGATKNREARWPKDCAIFRQAGTFGFGGADEYKRYVRDLNLNEHE